MRVGLGDVGRRLGVLALLILTLVYPVRAWFLLSELPWGLKAASLALAVFAWWAPRAAMLVFLAVSPLLAIVPSLMRWPPVSLASAWLWTLLVPAWLHYLWRPPARRLPGVAVVFLLVATASLAAGIYPLHLARDGMYDLWLQIDAYLRTQLIVATSQRPVLSPLLAWWMIAEGMGVLWLMCRQVRDTDRPQRGFRQAAVAIAIGAAATGLWAVNQWRTGNNLLPFWVEQDPYIVRVNASFTDVNALGAYLASVLALVAAVAFMRHESRWRGSWVAATVLVMFGAVFAASRIAWLAAGVSMMALLGGVLFWRLGTWSEARHRRLRVAATLASVAGLVMLASLTAWATVRDVRYAEQRSYLDTLLYTVNLHAPLEERMKGRGEFWHAAVNMLQARPLTGIGLGRYYKDLAAWVPAPEALERQQENAHNYFLQIGAELGVPGLLCFLGLFGLAFSRGFRLAREADDTSTRRLALAVVIGVGAFALTLMTGHSLLLHEGQVTFWALAGLAIGAPAAASPASVRAGRWFVAAALLVLAVTLPHRMAVEAGRIDLARLTFGLYDEERTSSGVHYNWTEGRALFHVPAGARVVTFDVRTVAPWPQTLQIRHGGRLIQQVVLSDQQWHTLRYVLPEVGRRGGYRRFELQVSPTWTPSEDNRELGVMLGPRSWTP